jgi:hypothetical protein
MKKKTSIKRILEPKKPRNAYQYFCIVISEEFRITKNGCIKKRGEMLSEIADLWKYFKVNPTPFSVLKRIRLEAEQDKIRYQKEMKEWHSLDDIKNRKVLEEKFKLEDHNRKIKFIKDINELFDEHENKDKEIQTDLLKYFIVI